MTSATRAEQQRIKEQIREEQKAQRELEREMKRLAAEQAAIEKALAEALARTKDEHSAEVEELKRRLAEAEEKGQRAISMAQQTKAGYVYVISNIGSFGADVFKIGMSRRLEPMDRVRELSGASLPFPFDIHMMLSSDDAPELEANLHRAFHDKRINRINLRKEFFNVTIDDIVKEVESSEGEVAYVAEPDALQYYESQQMTADEFEMISKSYETEAETA